MKLAWEYLKIFYKKFRSILFLIFCVICFFMVFWMFKIIVFDFPINEGKNNVDYYVALSQLFGGIIGGLLTVLGVAVTIFFTNNDRKQDLIMMDKPKLMAGVNIKQINKDHIITPKLNTYNELINEKRLYLENEIDSIQSEYTITNFRSFNFYVTNNADCFIVGIILGNSIIYDFDTEYVLKKDTTYTLDLSKYYFINENKTYQNIDLICMSLNERNYFYSLSGNERIIHKNDKKIMEVEVGSMSERLSAYEKIYQKLEKDSQDSLFEYAAQKLHEKFRK